MTDPTNAELDARVRELEEKADGSASSGYPPPPPGTALRPMFTGRAPIVCTAVGFLFGVAAAVAYLVLLWPADTMRGHERIEGAWTAAQLTSAGTFGLGALLLLTGVGLLSGEVMKLVAEPAGAPGNRNALPDASSLKDLLEAVGSLAGRLTPARLLIVLGVVLLLANAYVAKG